MLRKINFKLAALIILILILQSTIFCTDKGELYKEQFTAMSTVVNLIVAAEKTPDWEYIKNYMDGRAALYDHRLPGNPVYILNHEASAILPSNVLEVLKTALMVAEKSNGAFDPTVLPLLQLWRFDTGGGLPDAKEIARVLPLIDYRKVHILPGNKVTLGQGMSLDLGGIAKGAVVDELAEYFDQKGYNAYLIEAGGDLLLSGRKPDGTPWKVAIRHPWYNREEPGDKAQTGPAKQFVGIVELDSSAGKKAIVTSGDYERFFTKNGKRYHHIFDPRTGYPVEGIVSVTIIADNCTLADALSTAAFVLGFEKGLKFVEQFPGAEALLIRENNGGLEAAKTKGFPLNLADLTL